MGLNYGQPRKFRGRQKTYPKTMAQRCCTYPMLIKRGSEETAKGKPGDDAQSKGEYGIRARQKGMHDSSISIRDQSIMTLQ